MSRSVEFEHEEHKLKKIERRILKISGVQRDLDKLAKAGADRTQVLRLLGLAVFDHEMDWRLLVRQKRDALKRLAKQLRTVTDDAERLAEDPLSGAHFWLALLGMIKWDEVQWPVKSAPEAPFGSMMRRLAKNSESKARVLARVLRQGTYHQRRIAAVALSYYIRTKTGHDYDDEVARLLTDAHEAIGITKQFSAPQLKKSRQRHMRPSSQKDKIC